MSLTHKFTCSSPAHPLSSHGLFAEVCSVHWFRCRFASGTVSEGRSGSLLLHAAHVLSSSALRSVPAALCTLVVVVELLISELRTPVVPWEDGLGDVMCLSAPRAFRPACSTAFHTNLSTHLSTLVGLLPSAVSCSCSCLLLYGQGLLQTLPNDFTPHEKEASLWSGSSSMFRVQQVRHGVVLWPVFAVLLSFFFSCDRAFSLHPPGLPAPAHVEP